MKVELTEEECRALLSCMEYLEGVTGKKREEFVPIRKKLEGCIHTSSAEVLLIDLVRGYRPKKP